MKTLNQVIDKLESDGCITSDEHEELVVLLNRDEDPFPIDIDSKGDVWLYRRGKFPSQFKGYANDV
jgi:hypothetical protein